MKIGLIGLPQTGKKTLFELLTDHAPSEKELASNKPIKGIAEIKDPRFDKLVALYAPEKNVRARIEIEALPKLEKEAIAKGDIFKDIEDADALCHIVRAFKDDSVYHAEGSVDPKRDIDMVNAELILNDMIFIEKRFERAEKKVKETKEEAVIHEKDFLGRLKTHLDRSLPLRTMECTADDRKTLVNYPLITRKAMILVLNVSEDDVKDHTLTQRFTRDYKEFKIDVMQVSAKVEAEIAKLESEKEREEFLKALGIEEPAINALTRMCLKTLNLISFFTVGQDEVRQWTVKAGSTAPEAAGVIHTDLQKGFIRAEVMKYNDLIALGSEEKLKEAGKFYVKGKDYVVEDGDIVHIRFNV
ncbi:MAG: redox-regulated ATPase YchF [Candidatus Omnitrophica bacterium]|nr:redox-regulated ATPase YchF [Candidatus Omnitrophota bacterium]